MTAAPDSAERTPDEDARQRRPWPRRAAAAGLAAVLLTPAPSAAASTAESPQAEDAESQAQQAEETQEDGATQERPDQDEASS